jgi:hypothetical protein
MLFVILNQFLRTHVSGLDLALVLNHVLVQPTAPLLLLVSLLLLFLSLQSCLLRGDLLLPLVFGILTLALLAFAGLDQGSLLFLLLEADLVGDNLLAVRHPVKHKLRIVWQFELRLFLIVGEKAPNVIVIRVLLKLQLTHVFEVGEEARR